MEEKPLTECDIQKLKAIFSRGLSWGLGDENMTCIEGAISLARGHGLTDRPPCVSSADRSWSITINDARWSSNKVRADNLFPIALAQINTAGKDRKGWSEYIAIETVRRILPMVLTGNIEPKLVDACKNAVDLKSAYAAARAAAFAAYAARAVDAAGAAGAAGAAAYAAGAAGAAAYAAYAAGAAGAAARAAANAAYAAARAAANAAADAAYAADAARAADTVLIAACDIATEAYEKYPV